MLRFLFHISLCFLFSIALFSQENADTMSAIDILSKYSFEEILNLEVSAAEKRTQTVSEIPASVVIVEKEQIDKLGFTSYTEILEYITGFYMIDDYYYLGSKNFGVRGFFSTGAFSNVVILVNGVSQLSDEYAEYPDTKITVPVESIQRVEVIRGPMSVIYGNGAFFGAINIITTNYGGEITNDNHVSISYGDLNTKRSSVRFSGQKKEFKYTFVTGIHETDGLNVKYSDLTSDIDLLNYAQVGADATTKDHLDSKRNYYGINLQLDKLFLDLSYNESIIDVIDGLPAFGNGSDLSNFATNAVLGYDMEFENKWNLKMRYGYYYHSHLLNYERYQNQHYELDGKKSRAYDIELTLYKQWDRLNITTGIYRRNVLDLTQLADFGIDTPTRADGEIGIPKDDTYATHAAYSQLSYKVHEKLNLVAGIRAEHLEKYTINYARGFVTFGDPDYDPYDPENRTVISSEFIPANNGWTITPRVGAIYMPSKYHVLKLLYGQAVKQPAFLENLRQLLLGWPQLKAQEINTVELNYNAVLTPFLQTNISFFYNYLQDLIVSTNEFSTETGWRIYSSNSGKMQTAGFEGGFLVRPSDKFDFVISALVQHTKNLLDGYEDIAVGYSPETIIYGRFIYSPTSDISLGSKFQYVGEMESAWQTSAAPEDGNRIGAKSPAYFKFDVNYRHENLLNRGVFLNLKVCNVLDQEIRYPTTSSNSWIDKGTLGYGRTFLLSLGYKF